MIWYDDLRNTRIARLEQYKNSPQLSSRQKSQNDHISEKKLRDKSDCRFKPYLKFKWWMDPSLLIHSNFRTWTNARLESLRDDRAKNKRVRLENMSIQGQRKKPWLWLKFHGRSQSQKCRRHQLGRKAQNQMKDSPPPSKVTNNIH